MRVLQHNRRVHRQQVPEVHEFRKEVRAASQLRTVQAEVRVRQARRRQKGRWLVFFILVNTCELRRNSDVCAWHKQVLDIFMKLLMVEA